MTKTDTAAFELALDALPTGFSEGSFSGRKWAVTVRRSEDGRRTWLYANELGGTDIVSFNFYLASGNRPILKPCEMSSAKVLDFVCGFRLSEGRIMKREMAGA